MDARTTITEVTLCQASPNITTHPVLCALEDCTRSSVVSAVTNKHPVADWEDYNRVSEVLGA